jgi:D-beta-D-heptose 7-phosphate kinase/D-beta-D-heptose 1-phosphate adenosyltransferase
LKRADLIKDKILTPAQAVQRAAQWRLLGATIAFTNGVFDILHAGHIHSLSAAAAEADYLIVGINSDDSVRRLKGDKRPVNSLEARSLVMASLVMVDAVVSFGEDTPIELIKLIKPDVLVKGGDYKAEEVVGAKEVIAGGGRLVINPLLEGFSTTSIISKLKP